MYAVVATGGKQYRVSEGDVITVEKIGAEEGATIRLDQVLLVGLEDRTILGRPFVSGAQVLAKVLENGRGEKIIVYKYKRRKKYRRKQGHRQHFTRLVIEKIELEGSHGT